MGPAAVRRPITVTVWLIVSVCCLIASPLLIGVAALVSAISGRPQPLIFTRLAVTYFALELVTLIACGVLWLASVGGLLMDGRLMQHLHFRLLRWFVHAFARRWMDLLEIEVREPAPGAAARALRADGPLLYFSRHAGPGDTILIIDRLLTHFDRLPSVVFKESVAFDPCVDIIGHRLPHAVLDPSDGEACEARIEEIAAGLGDRGVLLLFPEGGNFTPQRRRRALRSLRSSGYRREAARAQAMEHMMPPRPGGALAALRGRPEAPVVFATHSGLGLAAFPREIWRQAPFDRTFTTRLWLADAGERPADPDAQSEWLLDWWGRLDGWVSRQGDEPVPAPAG
jgi:1-acyl-sn-glycerol-3-phosphate acyltransferase